MYGIVSDFSQASAALMTVTGRASLPVLSIVGNIGRTIQSDQERLSVCVNSLGAECLE